MLAYLRLLAKNRLAGFRPTNIGQKSNSKAKRVFSIIGLAILAIYLYGIVIFLEMLLYDQAAKLGDASLVIAVGLLACTMVTLLYSFFYVISMLFFSKDSSLIAALPIRSHSVLAAKLAVILAGEAGLSFLFMAPLMIRYGIGTGADVLFYIRMLVSILFVPMVPVAITTLLAFLLIRISALWKRREGMTTVASFVFMIAIMVASFTVSSNMSMGNEQQMTQMVIGLLLGQNSLVNMVLGVYPPLRWLNVALTQNGWAAWGNLLLFAALSVAAVALVVLLTGKSYLPLALKQEETMRVLNAGKRKLGQDRVRTPFMALLRQEVRDVIIVPTYASNCLTGVVMGPIMVVLIFYSISMNVPDLDFAGFLASRLPSELYIALAIAGLCMTSCMSMALPTAVSREGARHEANKTYPVSGFTLLMAKIGMGMIFNLVIMLLTGIAVCVFLPAFIWQTVLAVALAQLFSLLWCLMGLLLDVYHPRLHWKTEAEAVKQNFNGFAGMVSDFVLIALLVGAFFLCFSTLGLSISVSLGVVLLLVAVLDALLLKLLSTKGVAKYYEK